MNEAQSRGVLPDLVSWHYPFNGLTNQVETVNDFSNENGIDFDRISISEYLTPKARKNGNAAYAIAQIERTSIPSVNDVVIKAAGLDPEQAQLGVLHGLAQWSHPDQFAGGDPRESWWVYKTYADMDGDQTLQTIRGDEVEAYATTHTEYGQAKIKILLGTYGDAFGGSVGVNIYDLEPNYHYNYNIFRLIDNGDGEVDAPESVYGTVEAADSEGTLYIEVDWQDSTDCYYILLLG